MTTIEVRPRPLSRFETTAVHELMSNHAPHLLADGEVVAAHRVLLATGESHAIVVEEDGTCDGVISAAALNYAATYHATLPGLTVSDLVLTRQLRLTPASTVREALRLMLHHRTAAAPVVDVHGRPLGLVTWSGITKSLVGTRRTHSRTHSLRLRV